MKHMFSSIIKVIRNRPWLSFLTLLYLATMIAVSIPKSQRMTERSDHYVIWQSGKDFFNHNDLYYHTESRPYTYPPFAAFIFQPLHIIPLKVSANIIFLLNSLVLLPLAIFLVFKILKGIGVKPKKAEFAIILAVLFNLKYFWNNLVMFQINYFIFVIILTGIYYLIVKKPHISGILFTMITMIKIIPIFLVAYVFLFHFSRKVVISILITGIICLTLPITFRGTQRSVEDYSQYYETFIRDYIIEGRVVADQANHSLKAGVLKTFYPETRTDENVDISKYQNTILALTIIQVLLLCILIFNGYFLNRRKRNFSLAYLSSIILFTHLVSGITWTAHLVTLLFCILPVLLLDVNKLPFFAKIAYYFFIVIFVFLGIEGSDTVGEKVYLAIRFYDVYTYLLLSLFFYCSWVVLSKRSPSFYPNDIQI